MVAFRKEKEEEEAAALAAEFEKARHIEKENIMQKKPIYCF